MKIAAKISMTALTTVLSFGLVCASESFAQDSATATAPKVDVAPGPSQSPSSSQVSSSVKEALDSISVPGSSLSVQKDQDKQADKNKAKAGSDSSDQDFSTSSGKIPNSVKNVVKNLSETTEQVTLENLNAAREAVVKLDVLIDIEKRLNDLAKLRKAREEETPSIESSLPASALAPMPGSPQNPAFPSAGQGGGPFASAPMMSSSGSDYEVVRITGASSSFAAQIKDAGGATKLVRVGDKLSDGSKVTAISANGVSVTRTDKSRKTYSVKDAPALFVSQ